MNRRFLPFVALCALLVGVASTFPGCTGAGQRARDAAVNTVDLADDGVSKDVYRGIVELEAADPDNFDEVGATAVADAFFEALNSEDRWTISTDAIPLWPQVSGYALDGFDQRIANGSLTSGTAASLVERINRFGILLGQVADGAMPPGN